MGIIKKLFVPETEEEKEQKYYVEKGVRVKKGSKLDKAIRHYKKKGYYCTDLSFGGNFGEKQSFRKCPPTLRPALYGGTFHNKNYHHPLATREEVTMREEKGEYKQ